MITPSFIKNDEMPVRVQRVSQRSSGQVEAVRQFTTMPKLHRVKHRKTKLSTVFVKPISMQKTLTPTNTTQPTVIVMPQVEFRHNSISNLNTIERKLSSKENNSSCENHFIRSSFASTINSEKVFTSRIKIQPAEQENTKRNLETKRRTRRKNARRCFTPKCCLTSALLASLGLLALGAGVAAIFIRNGSSQTTTTTLVNTSTTSMTTTSITTTSSTSTTSTTSSTSITTSSSTSASTTSSSTTTTIATCTSCSTSCSYGLVFSLAQSNASTWGSGGTGYTTYTLTWLASSTTSATIQFQYYVTSCSYYWDLDSVSVKDTSGTEHITNGGFSSKSSWNETCGISSCGSIAAEGPSSSLVYLVNCCASPYYFSVSQTFTIVPSTSYTISFAMALANFGTSSNTNVYVYVY